MNNLFSGFIIFVAVTSPLLTYGQTIGPVLSLSASPASAAQRSPAAVWDGTQYVIIWEDSRSSSDGTELYLSRMTSDGVLIDSNGIRAYDSPIAGNQSSPAIAYNPSGNNLVYAWTDPRIGTTQIYAGRFSPQGTGQLLDGTGFAVSTNGAHAYPSIDCTSNACLIAHKQDGSSEIFGRRIAPDGSFMDANSIDLVSNTGAQTLEQDAYVLARSSDFILAWEDDRNASSGNTGTDLFFGVIPEQGNITALSPQTLVSAALRQTGPSLAYQSSSGEMWSVWQDQRAGNLDVWFGKYASSGTQLSQTALSSLSSNQVFPSLASGSSSSLVVWEDFRTAYGSIYGALLDTNGTLQSADAFPIMGFLGNAIEQIVVKGPGDDFLVLAVQSTPAPAKIYYRIIRDEAPSGTVSSALVQAPADGSSTADMNFGPFVGSSGFEIIDGTLFTVSFGSNVSINVPDADMSRGGHQVPSVNGRVRFGLSTTSIGDVSVSISSVRGTATGQGTARFTNVPPTVSQLVLSPSTPSASDDIELTYVYNDVNNTAEGMSEISWTKNNISQNAYDGFRTIPSSATSSGDRWRALVRPSDGTDFGSIAFSNTLIIGPAPGSGTGDACNFNSDCNSGFCTDNVCCENRCGGGGVDCQACSVAAGSSSNGQCEAVAAGTTCRQEYGECDVAEICNGVSTACPSNALQAVGTVCRAAVGTCDDAEYCSGVSPSCPSDSIMSSGTPCRGRMGNCDEPEFCDGMSAECPANVRIPANTICRNASGPCDQAETCDGQNNSCPADEMISSGTPCRPAIGLCDNTEVCDGMNALCPINTKKVVGETCREATDVCDKEEVCDGLSTECPDDQVSGTTVMCRAPIADCDKAEFCDGMIPTCPEDILQEMGAICRTASNDCDQDETCTGDSANCPEDEFVMDGTICDDENSCTENDRCLAGQCESGIRICMDPRPDAGSGSMNPNNMLPTVEEPKSILTCKCESLQPLAQETQSPVLAGLAVFGMLFFRRRK